MRKKIVLLLVVAVLIVGGVAAISDSIAVSSCDMPSFDPPGSGGGGTPVTPCGDELPDGQPL